MPDGQHDRNRSRIERGRLGELLREAPGIRIVAECAEPDDDAGQQKHDRSDLARHAELSGSRRPRGGAGRVTYTDSADKKTTRLTVGSERPRVYNRADHAVRL